MSNVGVVASPSQPATGPSLRNLRQQIQELTHGLALPPIPLAQVAGRLGVEGIDYDSSLPFSGVLVKTGASSWRVRCAARQPPARKRFTIAHELGHVFLERKGGSPWDQSGTEAFCDTFAAELLMPHRLFIADVSRFDVGSLFEFCRVFRTSLQATAIRCAEVMNISVHLFDEDGLIWRTGPTPSSGSVQAAARALLDSDHSSEQICFALDDARLLHGLRLSGKRSKQAVTLVIPPRP